MKNFKAEPWVLPQPVAIIGTYDEDGTPNAMNAAWVGQWDFHKVMISMGNHQTTQNLNRCGEFTIAFATEETLVEADFVGVVSGKKEHDKIAKSGLNAVKADNVNAPRYTNFPMTMECRIEKKLDESATGYYIIADIVNVTVDEKFLAEDGRPDVEKMKLITFDPIHNTYIALGKTVGKAFHDGLKLK